MFERIAPEQFDTLEGVPEPSETPRLVGHESVASMIAGAYQAGKLPHALLLTGPRGIGKATLAFHVAHHLLRHPTYADAPQSLAVPDSGSALFRQIAIGAHPGILHLSRPFDDKNKKFKTVISVDEIRRVSRFLSMTAHDGGYRVVIVDPADDMNTNAANALLKNLEEPPSRTIFLLIAHSAGGLLPTIRSRCQVVRLDGLAPGEMRTVFETMALPLPEDAEKRSALILRAGGSVRDAILLSEFGGLEILDTVDRLIDAPGLDVAGAHKLADAVNGRDREILFDMMNAHVLDRVSEFATLAAAQGNGPRAGKFSRFWQDLRIAINETDTYNLDRKQHALNMILRLHDTLRM